MNEEFKDRAVAVAVALGVLVLAGIVDRLLFAAYAEQERRQTSELLASKRVLLESRLNEALYFPVGLGAWVQSRQQIRSPIEERDFIAFAQALIEKRPSIRSLQLAPGARVRYVYPLKGNERAIGLNLFTHPSSRAAAERAFETGVMVVEGPTELVQGGTALIGRHPIFVSTGAGDAARAVFWGFATALIDFPSLLQEASLAVNDGALQLAIRGRDGSGERGDMIFGDERVFASNPVTLWVSLPHRSWQLAAVPVNGWILSWPGRAWLAISAVVLALASGMATWWMLDQARRLRVNERIFRDLASHDGLTGLHNRRGLDELLDREWSRCRRQSKPISLIMCDIDFFKQYNDAHGHAAGDDCLRAVATAILAARGRATDVVARYGGEEFVVLLPEVDASGGAYIAEIARQKILSLSIPHGASPYRRVSISAGVATMVPGENKFPGDLLAEADFGLYSAKQGGRNQVSARKLPVNAESAAPRVAEPAAEPKIRAGDSSTDVRH